MILSDCCCAPLVDESTEMCGKCKEHCDTYDDEETEDYDKYTGNPTGFFN